MPLSKVPFFKTNRSFLCRCLLVFTLAALVFQPHTVQAAHKDSHKKAKKSSHRTALAISPIEGKSAKSASILIDAESGTILSSDNPDALRHPASLTKMMTLLMVFDAVYDGRLREDQPIRVSARAASMPASKLGIRAGGTIRLDDAIASLATLSANDMAVALAETLGNGSESNFARMMTAKAQAIGMTRTRFYNASGLPNDYQVTTARDMARLARYLLSKYPKDSRIFSRQRFDYAGRTYMNHNHLMETYAGMDCCKTGFINASGFNLVASAKRDNRRLIGVVFGGRTAVTRNMEMASMLDDGFARAKTLPMAVAAKTTPSVSAQVQPKVQSAPQPQIAASTLAASEAKAAVMQAAAPTAKPAPLQIQKIASAQTPTKPQPEQILGTLKLPSDADGMGDQAEAAAVDAVQPAAPSSFQTASLTPPASNTFSNEVAGNNADSAGWSVQIGAYQTRLATDQAIEAAFRKLPANLRKNQSTVVPLRTADASWMFRARLTGFTKTEADQACKFFKDCLTISPQAY